MEEGSREKGGVKREGDRLTASLSGAIWSSSAGLL